MNLGFLVPDSRQSRTIQLGDSDPGAVPADAILSGMRAAAAATAVAEEAVAAVTAAAAANGGAADGAAARAEAFLSGMRAARTATDAAARGSAPGAAGPGAAAGAGAAPAAAGAGAASADAAAGHHRVVDVAGVFNSLREVISARLNPSPPPAPEGEAANVTPASLAQVLEKLNQINTRFQPFLQRYHQLLREDPAVNNDRAVRVSSAVQMS